MDGYGRGTLLHCYGCFGSLGFGTLGIGYRASAFFFFSPLLVVGRQGFSSAWHDGFRGSLFLVTQYLGSLTCPLYSWFFFG
jgi:hypothetical protein